MRRFVVVRIFPAGLVGGVSAAVVVIVEVVLVKDVSGVVVVILEVCVVVDVLLLYPYRGG